jgi:hypothetical protein
VKTASGATAVQIVYSSHRGSRDIEPIGSAHDDVQLEVLKAVARQRLTAGQGELALGLERIGPAKRGAGGGPLPTPAVGAVAVRFAVIAGACFAGCIWSQGRCVRLRRGGFGGAVSAG